MATALQAVKLARPFCGNGLLTTTGAAHPVVERRAQQHDDHPAGRPRGKQAPHVVAPLAAQHALGPLVQLPKCLHVYAPPACQVGWHIMTV